jgi:hypothetical protein
MSAHEEERIRHLLRHALPPVDAEREPAHDLWPAVLRRLDERPVAQSWLVWLRHGVSWFDWALLAGVTALTVAFPASIPLLLYYL